VVIDPELGKGAKDRRVLPGETLLERLRRHWRLERPHRWLFPGCVFPGKPVADSGGKPIAFAGCAGTVHIGWGMRERATRDNR